MARVIYLAGGFVALALALVGAALPIVPTVPFLLLAAFCFTRSRPEWAERLYGHPRFGLSMCDWRDRRAIGRRAKVAAIAAMSVGVVITTGTIGFPVALVSIAILLIVGPWIWTRPE